MKLVSPKNLLVSLLGCAFVVLKIVTFDGIADLFWILFIGYLSVKCLAAGLSQEAYDKDIKQAQQAGYSLGNNRCPGCSRHTHFQDNNGKQIQDNVHDRGDQ